MLMEYIEFTYSIRSYIRFIIEQIFKARFYRLNRIFFFFCFMIFIAVFYHKIFTQPKTILRNPDPGTNHI